VFEQCLQNLKGLLLHFDSYAGFAELSLIKVNFIDPELRGCVLYRIHGPGVYHFFSFSGGNVFGNRAQNQ